MASFLFEGANTALVTPFKDNQIDEARFRELIAVQIEAGVSGIVPVGTTGESPALSFEEKKRLFTIAVEEAKGKGVKVIAGSGTNYTGSSIELTQVAKDVGCDGVLLVTPYYNKPNQEGLFQHYSAVAKAVSIPQVVYNVPGRTARCIEPETLARIAEIPEVAAIKEATGDLNFGCRVLELCGDKVSILSGDDMTSFPLMVLGGRGVISVTSNVAPALMAQMCAYTLEGKIEAAKKIHYKLFGLSRTLFIDTNPIPVKAALHIMGRIGDEIRLPLTPLPEAKRKILQKALTDAGLL